MSKVLVLGPGATRLGDADVFEMAVGEAAAALVRAGHEVVVVTPRLGAPIAIAEKVALYIEPLTAASVAAIVAQEKPDYVLESVGGESARLAIDPNAVEPVDARLSSDDAEVEVIVARDTKGAVRVVSIHELVGARGVAAGDAIAVWPPSLDASESERATAAAIEAFTTRGAIGTVRLGVSASATQVLAVRSWYTRGVAFASRARGLDLGGAFALLAIGASLDEALPASPAVDGVVVRVPRFSFERFGERALDGTPKSTGETYGAGATFHEAWLKAVRALERPLAPADLATACDGRLEHALIALRGGAAEADVARAAEVRPWVVTDLARALATERAFVAAPIDGAALAAAKRAGFADRHLGAVSSRSEEEIRALRRTLDVAPKLRAVYTGVATLAYHGLPFATEATCVVAGAGPTRIGRTGDVDTTVIETLRRLRERGMRSLLVHTAPRGEAALAADGVCVDPLDVETLAEYVRLSADTLIDPLAAIDEGTPAAPSDAIKVDVDLLCDSTRAIVCGVVEYVERAGVHAGDSAAFIPPQRLAPAVQRVVEERAGAAALALGCPGAVRVRVAITGTNVDVLESSAGASTTLPLHSRVSRTSFAGLAVDLMLGDALTANDASVPAFVVARESVLPFRLLDAEDTRLGAAMRSTGDAVGVADTTPRAYAKALASVGVTLRRPTAQRPVALLVLAAEEKSVGVDVARRLRALGFELRVHGALAEILRAVRIPYQSGTSDPFALGDVGLAIVTGTADGEIAETRALRRQAIRDAVPHVTTIELALAVCAVLEESAPPTPRRF